MGRASARTTFVSIRRSDEVMRKGTRRKGSHQSMKHQPVTTNHRLVVSATSADLVLGVILLTDFAQLAHVLVAQRLLLAEHVRY